MADAVGADMFISERSYLQESPFIRRDSPVYGVSDALALVGLYLRTQGEYIVYRGLAGGQFKFNRGLFYLVGARELLPGGWRWFSACVQHSTHVGDDYLTYLSQALLQRVTRVLETRDRFHAALSRRQNNDTADDAVSKMDNLFLLLMGAVDVSARVAHYALRLPHEDMPYSGWQRKTWLSKVANRAPSLAETVKPGTVGESALTILRLLRNSIHGEAAYSVAYSKAGRERTDTLIGLPSRQRGELLETFEMLGGAESWGADITPPDRLYAFPGVMVERLVPLILDLLNDVMDRTPVEDMDGVVLR